MNRTLFAAALLTALAAGCSSKQSTQHKRESDRMAMQLADSERELDQARAQLAASQQELSEVKTQLGAAQARAAETERRSMANTDAKLQELQAELTRTGIELKQARAFGDQLKSRLLELNAKLENLQKSTSSLPSTGKSFNK